MLGKYKVWLHIFLGGPLLPSHSARSLRRRTWTNYPQSDYVVMRNKRDCHNWLDCNSLWRFQRELPPDPEKERETPAIKVHDLLCFRTKNAFLWIRPNPIMSTICLTVFFQRWNASDQAKKIFSSDRITSILFCLFERFFTFKKKKITICRRLTDKLIKCKSLSKYYNASSTIPGMHVGA